MDISREILQFLHYNPLSSRDEIAKGTAFGGSDATLKRMIAALVKNGDIVVDGRARATRYRLSNQTHLLMPLNLDTYFAQDVDERIHSMKKIFLLILLLISCEFINVSQVNAQCQFDSDEGCLNTIYFSTGPGLGEYGDRNMSVCYSHEKFLTDQIYFGIGIGYSHRDKYKISAVPIFASSTFFFLNNRFSPFVNFRLGPYATISKSNSGTNEKFSLPSGATDISFYMSPTIGIKAHITDNIGMMSSVGEESFLMKAYDTKTERYSSKLVSNLAFSVSLFFQIPGW